MYQSIFFILLSQVVKDRRKWGEKKKEVVNYIAGSSAY
jgi:hypothetical protein